MQAAGLPDGAVTANNVKVAHYHRIGDDLEENLRTTAAMAAVSSQRKLFTGRYSPREVHPPFSLLAATERGVVFVFAPTEPVRVSGRMMDVSVDSEMLPEAVAASARSSGARAKGGVIVATQKSTRADLDSALASTSTGMWDFTVDMSFPHVVAFPGTQFAIHACPGYKGTVFAFNFGPDGNTASPFIDFFAIEDKGTNTAVFTPYSEQAAAPEPAAAPRQAAVPRESSPSPVASLFAAAFSGLTDAVGDEVFRELLALRASRAQPASLAHPASLAQPASRERPKKVRSSDPNAARTARRAAARAIAQLSANGASAPAAEAASDPT